MSTLTRALIGSVSSCVSETCIYPIDVIKTRKQVGIQSGKARAITSIAMEIFRKEGLSGFYAGLSSQYVQTSLSSFIFFYFYTFFLNQWKKRLHKKSTRDGEEQSAAGPLIPSLTSSVAAAVTQLAFMTPVNVSLTRIKTNTRPASPTNRNLLKIMVQIWKRDGLPALYAGLGPALLLTLNPGIEFMITDTLLEAYDRKYLRKGESKSRPAIATFVIGMIGKMGATILTYPYILAKVRMQNYNAKSALQVIGQIILHNGLLGLFEGISIHLVKSMLNSAIRNTMKEKVERLVQNKLV